MSNERYAQKQAFDLVPETCPKVDAALGAAADAIKVQTGLLRDALVNAICRAEDAEDRVRDLEGQVDSLHGRIDSLNDRINELEKELAEALSEVST